MTPFSTNISPWDSVIKSCLLAKNWLCVAGHPERMPSNWSFNCVKVLRKKQCGAFYGQTMIVSSDSLAWANDAEDSSKETVWWEVGEAEDWVDWGWRTEERAEDEEQGKDDKKDREQSPRRQWLNREGWWQPGWQFSPGIGVVAVGSRLRKILLSSPEGTVTVAITKERSICKLSPPRLLVTPRHGACIVGAGRPAVNGIQ